MRRQLWRLLGRVMPWGLLHSLSTRYKLCWANVVSWKLGHGDTEGPEDLKPTRICFGSRGGWDYCGRWADNPDMSFPLKERTR